MFCQRLPFNQTVSNDTSSRPSTPSTPAHTAMPGFDFSNHNRNAALHAQGVPLPKATSTGTTIVGCIYDGGVVIAADTRATSGPIVADKVCQLTSQSTKKHHIYAYIPLSIYLTVYLRTVKNSTISLRRSGAQAPVLPLTPNSPLPSSPPTSSSTPCPQAASRVS